MKRLTTISLLLLVFCGISVCGQDLNEAKEHFKNENFLSAIISYRLHLADHPEDNNALKNIDATSYHIPKGIRKNCGHVCSPMTWLPSSARRPGAHLRQAHHANPCHPWPHLPRQRPHGAGAALDL